MIVVDASVAFKWLYDEPGVDHARDLLSRGEVLTAPSLLLLEIASLLRRKQREGRITGEEGGRLFRGMLRSGLRLVDDRVLAEDALQLAVALDHPVYDCAYLALALSERATLVTADLTFAAVARLGGYGDLLEVIAPQP